MNIKKCLRFCVTFICINIVRGQDNSFLWKPRTALTFKIPEERWHELEVQKPTLENIHKGTLVMFDGFHAGISLVSLIKGVQAAKKYKHHNPFSPYFYTNAYRWALRYMDLFPKWLAQASGHYTDTHKLWRKRYFYMDKFVPQWLRSVLNVFVIQDKSEWETEEKEFKQFLKYAEPSFGKHYFYPSKVFDDFKSQDTEGTIENLDSSDLSIHQTIK